MKKTIGLFISMLMIASAIQAVTTHNGRTNDSGKAQDSISFC